MIGQSITDRGSAKDDRVQKSLYESVYEFRAGFRSRCMPPYVTRSATSLGIEMNAPDRKATECLLKGIGRHAYLRCLSRLELHCRDWLRALKVGRSPAEGCRSQHRLCNASCLIARPFGLVVS